jgi:putative SOS response-associated peptidase YedK
MCGTASNKKTTRAIEERFKANFAANVTWEPILMAKAFSHDRLPVITSQNSSQIELYEWGLVPSFVKDAKTAAQLRTQTINCRTETIFEKPSFKNYIIDQRCLVLVDGFVEYQHVGKQKIPYYITLANKDCFAMGGIYNAWLCAETGLLHRTFSVATVPANPLMAEIHNSKLRMPLILDAQQENEWLSAGTVQQLKQLFASYDERLMHAHTISADLSKRNFLPHIDMYQQLHVPKQGSLF